jgi:mannose-6-phosphate isomerase-like protein (cupin superfamily)
LAHSDEALEVEATYAPGGSPPPAHLHPEQDERFEVRSGAMRTVVEEEDEVRSPGAVFEIPRGTPHQMWNDGEESAVLNWRTTPSRRTLEWFRELDALQRGEGRPNPAELLTDFSDTFRLVQQ